VATATTPPQSQSSNRSVRFNGVDAYADTPDAPELDPSGDWTVEAWFKDQDGFDHSRARILTKGDPYVEVNAPFALSVGTSQLEIAMRTGGQYVVLTYDLVAAGIQPNTWHHAAALFESSTRELELYVDGAKVARGISPVGSRNNTGAFVVGGAPNGACCAWNGEIDDVRVCNVARTAAQIQANYQTEIQSLGTAGLVGNWRFDEGTGQTAADSGGSPQNLALHSVTWAADVHP